jgi:hypothetical protein
MRGMGTGWRGAHAGGIGRPLASGISGPLRPESARRLSPRVAGFGLFALARKNGTSTGPFFSNLTSGEWVWLSVFPALLAILCRLWGSGIQQGAN